MANQLLPIASVLIKPVYAEEDLVSTVVKTTPITFDSAKNSFSFTVDTDKEVSYLLAYRTVDDKTEAVSGQDKVDSGTFTKEIYAGTCSENGNCVKHQVVRGILKTQIDGASVVNVTRFTITSQQLEIVSEAADTSLNLSADENSWLENPNQPLVSPSPVITPSPTPSVSPAPLSLPSPSVQPSDPPKETGPPSSAEASAKEDIQPSPEVLGSTQPEETGQLSAVIVNSETSLPVFDLDSANVSSAQLSTDKPDYAPTEIVIISGTSFAPNKDYALIISSTDEPTVNFETSITTNDLGEFTYAYQLDGNYRPNYKVEVKDENKIVAETTFTDAVYSVSTYSSNSYSTPKTSYVRGQTVFAKATSTKTELLRLNIKNPSNSSIASCDNGGGSKEVTCSYALPSNAALGTWYANVQNCSFWLFTCWSWADKGTSTFTVNSDPTPPVITYNVSPAPNAAGWNNSNPTVTWSVTDPESTITSQTGCNTQTINTETSGQTITCSATSTGGNSSNSVTIKLDKTAPVFSSKTTFSGWDWYKISKTSYFNYTDSRSGINSGNPASCTISTEGANQTCSVTPNVCDNAGNCSTAPVTSNGANIDKTAPSVNAGADQSKNALFTQIGSATDLISGIASVLWTKESGPGTISFGTASLTSTTVSATVDGTYVLRLTATDNAGNSSFDEFNLVWDTTAPTITINNPNTNPALSKTITASTSEGTLEMSNTTGSVCDGTLTFVSYASQTFTSESDNGKKVCYRAVDAATNTTYLMSDAIAGIDKTGPTTPGQIGWSSENPPVGSDYASGADFNNYKTCGQSLNYLPLTNLWGPSTDANAGVAGYDREVYSPNSTTLLVSHSLSTNYVNGGGATNGNTYWTRIRAYDALGNKGTWTSLCAITYDTTAPVITVDPYNTSWTNQNITVTASTNEGILNTTSHQFTTNGSFDFVATDTAGNITTKTVTITNIDKTAPGKPTITSPTAEQYFKTIPILNQWSVSSDTGGSGIKEYQIKYTYDHHLAGRQDTIIRTVSGTSRNHTPGLNEQDGVTIWVQAIDNAGNESGWSTPVHYYYDATAPALASKTTFSGWYNTNRTSTFTYADTNGVASGNNPTCDITTQGTNQTCSITPNVCDAAGNCNTTTVTSNGADIDFTDPDSTITDPLNSGTDSTIITNSWNGSIKGAATDTLSHVNGVQISIQKDLTQYFDGTSFVVSGTEILLNTSYATGNWEYAGLTSPAQGTYTIKSHATDNAGNIEDTYTLTIILDKTIPEVALSINPLTADGSNGWYKTQPEVTLTATDTNIDKIEYQWDSQTGSWTTYSAPFKPGSEGAHILYYRAHDLADNYSEVGIKNISWDETTLDKGPQNLSVSPNPSNGNNVKVTWEAAQDNVGINHYRVTWKKDGVDEKGADVSEATFEYTITDNLSEGDWTIKVTAYDQAGFTADTSTTATVDLTGPIAPILSMVGTGTGSVSLAWNAISDATDYSVWYGTATGVYDYAAHVGNVTSYTIQGLGTGLYYVVVAAYDTVGNRGTYSNEVNTATTIAGIPGAIGPATGFLPAPEVLGVEEEATPPASGVESPGTVLGEHYFGWWPWLLTLFPAWFLIRYYRRRKIK
ncbi:MAG: hypothetical protein NTZ93_02915 [Candidatus Beckwithbacteria bacterium]|nr:hypothetical protein [Candidatus Beckwithbacteria bacterium]